MPTACPPHTLARIRPIICNFFTPIPKKFFQRTRFLLIIREPHISLFPHSTASQMYSLCFRAGCKSHSFSLAAFLKLLYQIAGCMTQSPCASLFFFSARQRQIFFLFCLQPHRLQNLLRNACQLLAPSVHQSCDIAHNFMCGCTFITSRKTS